MSVESSVETREFQSEARQLLRLVIHSVYSNKDIFLRELISNASDALDKLRLESYRDKDLDADTSDLRIELIPDPAARTLTVRDNGIGMSRDEVVTNIGTIAKSGTAEFLAKLKESSAAEDPSLIGQFGIGFYASFMVADRVTLVTRRAGETEGVRWESDGGGTYTLEPAPDAQPGTAITLHLKPADADDHLYDYTDPATLRRIVTRYSDFITWPIKLIEPDGKGDPETINSRSALWARPKDKVSEDEYRTFYQHIAHDWQAPLETIRLQAEGTFEYQALLFLPSRAPADLYLPEAKRGVQLYVKRVFIMDDCEPLVPRYLRYVKGVVDAQDLSLNVSREILQQDRQLRRIRNRLVKKVLSTIATMRTEAPEKYQTFWRELGRATKEGLVEDPDNREAILDICSFASTKQDMTSLRDYKSRMPEGQSHIYVMTGESRAMVENSPHLEAFQAKGYEVLILTDPIDEMWVETITEFDGTPIQCINKGEVDLGSNTDKPAEEERQREFTNLLSYLGSTLADHVKQVRLSARLTTSPACLVRDPQDLSPALEKMYRAMGQEVPPIKRILELNPDHPLITGMQATYRERGASAELAEAAELLYAVTLLAEGGELPDPARFRKLVLDRVEQTL